MDTTKMTPEDAEALLQRDQLNRVKRVAEKGGILSLPDRKQLSRIVKRAAAEKNKAPKEKKAQLSTAKETKFVGTFEQKRRRRKVYELRLRNYSIRDIMSELDVSKSAVVGDLEVIDAALQKQIDPVNATAIINETLANLEAVMLIALESLPDAEGNERAGLLNTITKASEVKIGLLQDAGTLPKIGRKMELSGPDGGAIPTTATIIQPIMHVVFEQTEETRALERKYNVLPEH